MLHVGLREKTNIALTFSGVMLSIERTFLFLFCASYFTCGSDCTFNISSKKLKTLGQRL